MRIALSKQLALTLTVMALGQMQVSCAKYAFEGVPAVGVATKNSDAEPDVAPRPQTPSDPSAPGACNYPVYPSEIASRGACTPTIDGTGQGNLFSLRMYNASNLTHAEHVLQPQGLSGSRYITYQNVIIADNRAPNSIDLRLESYEPVEWRIQGNTRAVRSVRVNGYHCASVTGVLASLVTISTYEQGRLPDPAESATLNQSVYVYDGSCFADRAFRL
jgi:hypothetical protein